MSRDMEAAVLTETVQPDIRAAILAELDFSSDFVRAWTGVGDLSWDSKTWNGVGELGEISPVAEKAGTVATGMTLGLSGVDSTLLSSALTEEYQGRSVGVWLAFFDDALALIADPVKIFGGIMDNMSIVDSGPTSKITINCESYLRILERSNERRYTDQDQQDRFTGDLGCQLVARQLDDGLYWGRANPHQTKQTRKALRKKEKRARKGR